MVNGRKMGWKARKTGFYLGLGVKFFEKMTIFTEISKYLDQIEDQKTRLEKGNYLIQIGKKRHFKLKISWFVFAYLLQ